MVLSYLAALVHVPRRGLDAVEQEHHILPQEVHVVRRDHEVQIAVPVNHRRDGDIAPDPGDELCVLRHGASGDHDGTRVDCWKCGPGRWGTGRRQGWCRSRSRRRRRKTWEGEPQDLPAERHELDGLVRGDLSVQVEGDGPAEQVRVIELDGQSPELTVDNRYGFRFVARLQASREGQAVGGHAAGDEHRP